MVVNITQFQKQCIKLIDEVCGSHTELVITKHGKPLVKLVSVQNTSPQSFIGSLTDVGETVGDLLAPFDEEWETD